MSSAKIDKEKLAIYLPDFDKKKNAAKLRELERKAEDSYHVRRKFGRLEVGDESAIYDLDAWLTHLENQIILNKRYEWVRTLDRKQIIKKENVKYFIRHGFLPLSWDIYSPISPSPTVSNVSIPKVILQEAIHYKTLSNPPIKSVGEGYDFCFQRVMIDIFDLEVKICFRNQYQIESLIESIAFWIDDNIESYIYTNGVYIKNHFNELFERIYCLEESDFSDYWKLECLVNKVDELADMVCTYCGYNFKKIKEDIGYDVNYAKEYLDENRFHLDEVSEENEDYEISKRKMNMDLNESPCF